MLCWTTGRNLNYRIYAAPNKHTHTNAEWCKHQTLKILFHHTGGWVDILHLHIYRYSTTENAGSASPWRKLGLKVLLRGPAVNSHGWQCNLNRWPSDHRYRILTHSTAYWERKKQSCIINLWISFNLSVNFSSTAHYSACDGFPDLFSLSCEVMCSVPMIDALLLAFSPFFTPFIATLSLHSPSPPLLTSTDQQVQCRNYSGRFILCFLNRHGLNAQLHRNQKVKIHL